MYKYNYYDYKKDESSLKEKGTANCEMHEISGWGHIYQDNNVETTGVLKIVVDSFIKKDPKEG